MLRYLVASAALLLSLAAYAGDDETRKPLPFQLTFGYEDENKVDASPKGCAAWVREEVQWDPPEMEKAIHDVCAARKRHVDAYAAIQKSYKALAKHIGADNRIDAVAAVTAFEAMVKACIDHKSNITTGGHSVVIDIIPNHIAAECLKLGKDLLDSESAWFDAGGFTDARPSP